jgi:Subtilase family
MATRYLIGRGEQLTYAIDPPPKSPRDKNRPYSLAEAQASLLPQVQTAIDSFRQLPEQACPDEIVVARLQLHPAFIAKSYYPKNFLDHAGLAGLGSRTVKVMPRKLGAKTAPETQETTELFVGGRRSAMAALPAYIRSLREGTPEALQFAQTEALAPMVPADRLRAGRARARETFEAVLHIPPTYDAQRVRAWFAAYARGLGFVVAEDVDFEVGRLLFLAVSGPTDKRSRLAEFTLLRLLRVMPKLRSLRPLPRSGTLKVGCRLPTAEPLSPDTRVAILDGGLPERHALERYVRRYQRSDPNAADKDELLEHGLGVTSAFLFGPIVPDGDAPRPYTYVDHHRVLDASADDEGALLYRTLNHIEDILRSRTYPFVNLSLGPDDAMVDDDVHAWTAVIDDFLSDGETVLAVAVGNNGGADEALGLNRIQVPADSVNALSVGAADRQGANWQTCGYSARGPGRSPGRRKPDVVAYGGSAGDYFHVVAPGRAPALAPQLGTSFASPLALRMAAGIRAVLGDDIKTLTTKALLVHGAEFVDHDAARVGWGRVPTDLGQIITCAPGEARVLYQGELRAGKFLRAPIPLPTGLAGMVSIRATFCYASHVDPQDAAAYTKAGLLVTFRPHEDQVAEGASQPKSKTFFPAAAFRHEPEQRTDLGKWETVLHSEHTFRAASLKGPHFDVHYNARANAGALPWTRPIRYALVVTIQTPRHADIFDRILAAHPELAAIEPQVKVTVGGA